MQKDKDMKNVLYDLAIVGAGPAGLNASVYASRYGLKNVIIGQVPGGLTTETHEIGNWLGTEKITGAEFAQKAYQHAQNLKADIKLNLVDNINKKDNHFKIILDSKEEVLARTILLALGSKHRKLNIPGEKELAGKGVSYCATCDGFFYKNKNVIVVGGSDSAAVAAIYLGDIAKKVYLIYRKNQLRAEKFWQKSILSNSKIEVIYNTNLLKIEGNNKVEKVILDNPYKNSKELKIDGVFVEIGSVPNNFLAKQLGIELDEDGYIKINADGSTSLKGVWAAGDITTGSNKFKQIVTAAAEGAIAVNSIQNYLKK